MAYMNCGVSYKFNGHDVYLEFRDYRDPSISLPIDADLDDPSYFAALQEAQREHTRFEAYAELSTLLAINKDDSYLKQYRRQPERYDRLMDEITEAGIEVQDFRVKGFFEHIRPLHRPAQPIQIQHEKAVRELQGEGFVYLLQSPSGAYKIGRTKNPNNRLRTFGVQLPFEVAYLCIIQTRDMRSLERDLHSRFRSKRVNGEWFHLAPEDVEYIKGLAS